MDDVLQRLLERDDDSPEFVVVDGSVRRVSAAARDACDRAARAGMNGGMLEMLKHYGDFCHHFATDPFPEARKVGQQNGTARRVADAEIRRLALTPIFRAWFNEQPRHVSLSAGMKMFVSLTSDPAKAGAVADRLRRHVDEHGTCSLRTLRRYLRKSENGTT